MEHSRAWMAWAVVLGNLLQTTHGRYTLADSGPAAYNRLKGCITLSVGTYTRDMSVSTGDTACIKSGSTKMRCPPCFMFDTTLGPVSLTLSNCHKNTFQEAHSISVLTEFVFANVGNKIGTVSDSYATYIVPKTGSRGSTMRCLCYSMFARGYLSCDASHTHVNYLAPYDSMSRSTACATISTDNVNLNIQYPACGFRYCPNCFNFLAFTQTLKATFTNCQWMQGLNQDDDAALFYYFANSGNFSVKISDGTTRYTLSPGSIPDDTTAPQYHANQISGGASSMFCVCYNSKLQCSSPAVNDVRANQLGQTDDIGTATFPERLSVNDAVHLGSALSVRSFTRLGSAVSMLDFAHLGSSLSIRSYARFGSTFKVQGRVTIADSAYFEYASSKLNFYVGGNKAMALTNSGGSLHGTWQAEQTTTISDSRRKVDVKALSHTLAELLEHGPQYGPAKPQEKRPPRIFGFPNADAKRPEKQNKKHSPGWESSGPKAQRGDSKDGNASGPTSEDSTGSKSEDPASWILRELRPVSYKLKESKDSARHYGFVAEELERILPDVVYTGTDSDKMKSVAYQDLIALLVQAFQAQHRKSMEQEAQSEKRFSTIEERLARMDERFTRMQTSIEHLAARFGACSACNVV